LIENGANIDAIGDMGETPLHVAISKNEKRVIDALLEAGARTDIVSEFGQTQAEKARQYSVSLREDT
jgi:ankyrin repeat protein